MLLSARCPGDHRASPSHPSPARDTGSDAGFRSSVASKPGALPFCERIPCESLPLRACGAGVMHAALPALSAPALRTLTANPINANGTCCSTARGRQLTCPQSPNTTWMHFMDLISSLEGSMLCRCSGTGCLQPGPRRRVTVGGSLRSWLGAFWKDIHRALGGTRCLWGCPASCPWLGHNVLHLRRLRLPGRPRGRRTGRAPGRPRPR